MTMDTINNNASNNLRFGTMILSLTVLTVVTYLLIAHYDMVAYGIADSDLKSNTPIKHVIVISQGKRSFDNYFGTFPGANGFPTNITVPLNPFPQPVVKFSVEAWFNTNSTLPKSGFLVNKGGIGVDTPGENMNYGIWMNPKGKVMAGFENKNGTDYEVTANGTYNNGKWHNVVVTYDGKSDLSLFIDGNLTGTVKTGGAIPDLALAEPLRIGANSLSPGNFFTGFVDEVRIWNKALNYSQITRGYNNNSFDSSGQLVYLPFEDGNRKIKVDNNVITSSSPFQPIGLYLNGSSYQDIILNTTIHSDRAGPFHLEKTKTEPLFDSSKVYEISYNKGLMNGFLLAQILNGGSPELAMGYYDEKDLPYYWNLASQYVLADHFFAPSMESGLANQQYLYAGNSTGYQRNSSFPGLININNTIFDEIQANKLSWKVYVEDYDPNINYSNNEVKRNRYVNLLTAIPRFVDNKTLNSNIVGLPEYFRDLSKDNFPAVSYIVAQKSDESAPKDVTDGHDFVSSLVLALMRSKHWNDSLFIVTYRESGGWYDHVVPPATDGHLNGFRVPTLIISPYAKEGYVDSTVYDVTSILKFIEYNFGLKPLSTRDANANSILKAFDFEQPPRKPVELNSSIDQNEFQNGKIVKLAESTQLVNTIYLGVLCLIPIIAVIVWILRGRLLQVDSIQNTDHR